VNSFPPPHRGTWLMSLYGPFTFIARTAPGCRISASYSQPTLAVFYL